MTIHAPRGLAFCLAALPLAVQAQSTSTPDTSERLNPVVVTAALAPRTADQSLSSVTLLDEATLRRQDPDSITDLLRAQPGVDLTTFGSYGKQTSLFMRGAGSNANVLLIDGIRLRSATSGAAAWEFLDPRMFERAEIVRGPRGSLYGADAVGGVVQLFTRDGDGAGEAPHVTVDVGGGSDDTQRATATLSGGQGGTRYLFAGSHFGTDGAPVRRDGDDKGFDNTTGLVRLSHTFDDGAEVGVLALRARGNTEFDESGPADEDFVQQVAGVYGELPLGEAWRSRVTLSEARDERDTLAPLRTNQFATRTQAARWDNTVTLGRHELVGGVEASEDRVASDLAFDETRRDNLAVFAQGLFDFSPLLLQASLRHDDNQAFGNELTGSLALGYELDGVHTLRGSVGSAFRAPTFNELYYPGFSNPDLSAERSESLEVGVRGQHDAWFWDLSAYRTEVDDLIGPDANFLPVNVDRARLHGAELAVGAELADWTLQAAVTWTDPEDRDTGNRLARRATQSLRLDADRQIGDWSLGGTLLAQNSRYNDAANQDRLPGYGQLNLRAGWAFAEAWTARLGIDNVLDKEVVTVRGSDFDPVTFEAIPFDYLNAGRSVRLSVSFATP
ncbi:TonB-dependent receptor domain-containing protein [Halomonas urumqiensis]|uniref:TonB-dependent receptor n=1 Tax=Halomonas urumqiensis TaxID=1684789 RepID=A0A2N7UKT1_9GAMM|nr:TonB-dependent receptor [Halomonas urumqiensis]PMR81022.1 TonB-dependent receptor [Halomonas urumqiensis]PTB01121.1 TonB-dependent receptor [Halomonas urumqiensis]GHE22851.1 TonB-dependent receptor [Halomonas urumqiensis]